MRVPTTGHQMEQVKEAVQVLFHLAALSVCLVADYQMPASVGMESYVAGNLMHYCELNVDEDAPVISIGERKCNDSEQ